jgi:hypothetical protein
MLVLILGALYATQTALRDAEHLPRGVTFKFPARWILYFNTLLFLGTACLIILRIVLKGLKVLESFQGMDLFILFVVLMSYSALTIEGLVVSRIKRKYTPDLPWKSPNSH